VIPVSMKFGALLLAAGLPWSVNAAQRTFVAAHGSDVNTSASCSNASPCRGFNAALSVTDAGGEIVVLNSGSYDPVSIGKSVSIIAPEGVHAGISVSSGDGVSISGVDAEVTLRGLSIKGFGGAQGILMTSGKRLTVVNCSISGMASAGLRVLTAAAVTVRGSRITGNSSDGIYLYSGVRAIIHGTTISENSGGLLAWSAGAGNEVTVEIARSAIERNAIYNLYAESHDGAKVQMAVKSAVVSESSSIGIAALGSTGTALIGVANSLISGSAYAGILASGPGAKIFASSNTIIKNQTGLMASDGAVMESDGGNALQGNTTAISGSLATFARM